MNICNLGNIWGKKMETVTDFIFWGSKITADGVCSHEIRRHLLFGRKAMTSLESLSETSETSTGTKQRHHFADKGLYSQSYGFPSSDVRI